MLSTTQKVSKHYDCDNDDDNNRKIIKNNNNKKLSNFLISITSHLYCLEMFHWLRTFSPAYSKVYCSIQTEFYKAFSRYSKFQKKHFTISYLLSVWFFSNLYYTRSFLVHSLHSRVSLPHWINVITVVFCTLYVICPIVITVNTLKMPYHELFCRASTWIELGENR